MLPNWLIITSSLIGFGAVLVALCIPLVMLFDWFGEVNRQRKALKRQKLLDCHPELVERTDKLTKDLEDTNRRLHDRVATLTARVAFLEDQLYPQKKGKSQSPQRKQIVALREAGIKYDPNLSLVRLHDLYAAFRGQYSGRGLFSP